MKIIGVKEDTLAKYGSVSHQVAKELAKGGKKLLEADICVADTGIAGPGGASPGKPVGLFSLGLCHRSKTLSREHIFGREREKNKKDAADAVLAWLKEYLLELK